MEKEKFVFVGKFNDLGVENTQEFGKGTLLIMGDVSAMLPTKLIKVSSKGEKYITLPLGFKIKVRTRNGDSYSEDVYVVDGKYNSFSNFLDSLKDKYSE